MRFGCCVGLDKLQAVQDAGYDYVELPVSVVRPESADDEVRSTLEGITEFEIAPEVWNRLLPADMKVVGPEVDKYRIERYLRTAFERIEELGGEVVVFGSGKARMFPDGFPTDEANDQLTEFLTLAGQVAGPHGITLAVQPLNQKETNTIGLLSDALAMIHVVDHPFVKIAADLHHMQESGESMDHLIDAGPEIVHVHTADTGRRNPGSGSYPHAEFFEALKTIGYNDRLSIECEWRDFPAEIAKSLEFLRNLDAEMPS